MDGSRFDDLTRALGATRSRRSLLGALAAAALATLGLRDTSAGRGPPPRVCGGACCPTGSHCQNGACVRPGKGHGNPGGCPSGEADCGGDCVAIASDVNNCGACGNACPRGMPATAEIARAAASSTGST